MKSHLSPFGLALVLANLFLTGLLSADSLPNAWQVNDNTNNATVFYWKTNSSGVNQAATNLTGGWSFTVNARMVTDYGTGNQAMFMIYGDGVKRWEILWSLKNGDLQSYLYNIGGTPLVTSSGTGTNFYHTHQIIYNSTSQQASYLVDGQVLTNNWTGSAAAGWPAGEVAWGAISGSGVGKMNFHSISFIVTNGIVAAYDVGNNPASVPDPISQGWFLSVSPPPAGTSTNAVLQDKSFLPTALTQPADQFTLYGARLNGQANPGGSPAFAWFEWGTDTNYGNTTAAQDIGTGFTNTPVAGVINGLSSGLAYHFRLVVSNAFGAMPGSDQSFDFAALRPLVTTQSADQFTPAGARLNGSVNPNGWPTMAWFQWGTDTNYGNMTTPQNVGAGAADVMTAGTIGPLVVGQDYHYRLVATNAFGNAFGADQSFHFENPLFYFLAVPGLAQISYGTLAWGDYDNDGRLDFLISGGGYDTNGTSIAIAEIWHQNGDGSFSNATVTAAAGLPGFESYTPGSVAWGDYDNDGHLDFLITGDTTDASGNYSGALSEIWHNNGNGTFANVTATAAPGLPPVDGSTVAWGDYDNNGHLDFVITGDEYDASGNYVATISEIWRNNGNGTFSNVTATAAPGLPGLSYGSLAWGDYDNDGRLDFLVTGDMYDTNDDFLGAISEIWHNNGDGTFANVTAFTAPGLPRFESSSVAWGDYDNDGQLDFLLAGNYYDGTNHYISQLWRNTGSGFTNMPLSGLPGVEASSVAWGDYDSDGRLDFLLVGRFYDGSYHNVSQLWRNNLPVSNSAPAAPTNLASSVSLTNVTFTWRPPTDDHTPPAGLSYNLRIGTTPGGSQALSPQSAANGFRRVPALGNTQTGTNAFITLPSGTYYWSIQAVDGAFTGSAFAPDRQITIISTVPPLGDFDGDGIVDESELNTVLNNYWQTSPPNIQSVVSPVNTTFRFDLENLSGLNFHVLASTNVALPLMNWTDIGPATLQFQFTDPSATNYPARFYQLIWP